MCDNNWNDSYNRNGYREYAEREEIYRDGNDEWVVVFKDSNGEFYSSMSWKLREKQGRKFIYDTEETYADGSILKGETYRYKCKNFDECQSVDTSDRHDRYGIYFARMCDECWEHEYARTYTFDKSYAGENLDESY